MLLAESERFPKDERRPVADVDTAAPLQERLRLGTFDDNRRTPLADSFRRIDFQLDPPAAMSDCGVRSNGSRSSRQTARLALDCYEAYNIQVSALEQRLRAIGGPDIVIGVSGGLDSTPH